MDVHETTCGLVEMLGFAVDVFRAELPRQDRYAYHGNTAASCEGARTLAVRAPMRSAKGAAGQYGMGAPSPSGIGL